MCSIGKLILELKMVQWDSWRDLCVQGQRAAARGFPKDKKTWDILIKVLQFIVGMFSKIAAPFPKNKVLCFYSGQPFLFGAELWLLPAKPQRTSQSIRAVLQISCSVTLWSRLEHPVFVLAPGESCLGAMGADLQMSFSWKVEQSFPLRSPLILQGEYFPLV